MGQTSKFSTVRLLDFERLVKQDKQKMPQCERAKQDNIKSLVHLMNQLLYRGEPSRYSRLMSETTRGFQMLFKQNFLEMHQPAGKLRLMLEHQFFKTPLQAE